jgi:hypothetical protein
MWRSRDRCERRGAASAGCAARRVKGAQHAGAPNAPVPALAKAENPTPPNAVAGLMTLPSAGVAAPKTDWPIAGGRAARQVWSPGARCGRRE